MACDWIQRIDESGESWSVWLRNEDKKTSAQSSRSTEMNKTIVITAVVSLIVAALASGQEEPRKEAAAKADSRYTLEVESGTGYDSNSFNAPDGAYTDPGAGTIVPEIKPGLYFPLSLDTEYELGRGRLAFVPALKFHTDLYPLAQTQGATDYYFKLEPALELLLSQRGIYKNTLFVDPFFVLKRSTYVDHDTGLEVANQGQLYSYTAFGADSRLRFRSWHPFGWELRAGVERRDYSEVTGTVSLDRTELFGAVELSLEIIKPTDLSLGYTFEFDNYDNRHARDLSGNLVGTVLLDYVYHDLEATLRHRFGPRLVGYLDYTLTFRQDPYLGYNDYIRNEAGIRVIFKTDRLKIRVAGSYWDKSYPRSFAFDDPAYPVKHFQSWEADLGVDIGLTRFWSVWADYGYRNQTSTDPRYDYDRHQVELGARFTF
jgi:hypothetical protein